ncbi:MAG: hypothetical protein HOI67_09870 [Gammaproteobacteria bacterium]|nr:hypothetical protein [Gammaproteobacteria bacterium]
MARSCAASGITTVKAQGIQGQESLSLKKLLFGVLRNTQFDRHHGLIG